MEIVNVQTKTKNYDCIIEKGILKDVGKIVREKCGIVKACIVTDDNVDKFYGEFVKSSLEKSGIECKKFVFKFGENSKTIETYFEILRFLADGGFTRTDIIVALGGGIPGDMGGFAAATYLRGIRFVQIPTTLLSCVDSSVGGKTAVNLPEGKNLVGAFYQPEVVICDPDTLNTLPDEIFADGCSEVIKYGIIEDKTFFEFLEKNDIRENIEFVIKRSIEMKRDVVARDETEQSIRAILNYGHTVAHGVEKLSKFEISHGSAVAIGMVIESRGLFKSGRTNDDFSDRLVSLLKKNSLPCSCNFSAKQLFDEATFDKKRSGDTIKLINIRSIGTACVEKIKLDELLKIIEAGI